MAGPPLAGQEFVKQSIGDITIHPNRLMTLIPLRVLVRQTECCIVEPETIITHRQSSTQTRNISLYVLLLLCVIVFVEGMAHARGADLMNRSYRTLLLPGNRPSQSPLS
jgi:hypothetical protein